VLVLAVMASRRECWSMSPLSLAGKDVAREGRRTSHRPPRILEVMSVRYKTRYLCDLSHLWNDNAVELVEFVGKPS
jgi:hypothetical protein